MSITLPIDEMLRLRLSLKLGPDSRLTFEMLPINVNRSPLPGQPSFQANRKLRFEGKADGTGSLQLDVWVEDDIAKDSVQETSSSLEDAAQAADPFSFHDVFFSQPSQNPNLDDAMDISYSQPESTLSFDSWPNYYDANRTLPIANQPDSTSLLSESFNSSPWGSDLDMTQIMSSFEYPESPADVVFPSPDPEPTLAPVLSASAAGEASSSSLSRTITFPSPSTLPTTNFLGSSENGTDPHSSFSAELGTLSDGPDGASPSNTSTSHNDTTESATEDLARPWPCLEPGCPKRFTRSYTRSVHMGTHTRAKQERKVFPCRNPGCPENFGRKHDRLRHEVGIHKLDCEWTCKECSRVFSSETSFERHLSSTGHPDHRGPAG
ncbi:hypothetical protein D9758_011129 [Tetrapyrgos nigripes]|uniref:C2H2-type domain-containing protein n=1 Tax=Tetrapyrgos nigripes TaxID=182062 RepID=A0A8H5CJV7_9AGAR|nr:hypothetical protein D9758_011129 [Tetrapyrgos nigripes]